MVNKKNTLSDKLMQQYGIKNLQAWVQDYKMFEEYVSRNHEQVADEAWADVNNEDKY